MSGYSYEEMQNMQRRAMERVQIMRKKSEDALNNAKNDLEVRISSQENGVKPKITNMPPNFPAEKQYPTFKEFFNEEKKKQVKKEAPIIQKNPLESILSEPDKAILLGLIMLLQSEGADETLIMALMYIMN
jgi:hypothetical protein